MSVLGQKQTYAVQYAMSALGQKRTSATLFDHLVGLREQRWRDRYAKCLSCLEVDHQFVLGWRLYREIGRTASPIAQTRHRSGSKLHRESPTHVRFGSEADICAAKRDVRFIPESRHVRCNSSCLLWAQSRHLQCVP